MALPTKNYSVYEDQAPDDYGLPQYVLDRLNVGAPPATTIDFGQPAGALTQAAPAVDTVAQDYWNQQAALQQAEWERQAAAQQAEWERQAKERDAANAASTTTTGGLPTTQATTPSNVLSGNILAGASWNSLNPTIESELTALNGQPTFDASVGGATTGETLKQLNDFTAAGGSFAPGSTVFLQTGGLDLVYGVDKNVVKSNIDQIVSDLEARGVNVVLTGSPYAASFEDVKSNNFNPALDSIYSDIAGKHSNVALVDTMGQILQDKSLLSDFIHPNAAGWEIYNKSVMEAYERLNPSQKIAVANKVEAGGVQDGATAETVAKAIDEVAGTNVAITAAKAADTAEDTAASNAYFKANPDVAAAYAANSNGMTPEQYAQSHYESYGADEGRQSPSQVNFQSSDNFKNAIDLKNGLFLTPDGRAFYADGREEKNWNALDKSVVGNANLVKLTKQILDQGTTAHWSGQGWGSPEANAASIASALLKVGIDNIYDLGKVPVYEDVQEIGKTYNGQRVFTRTDENTGQPFSYIVKPSGQYDQEGNETSTIVEVPKDAKLESIYGQYDGYEGYNQVDPSKLKTVDGKLVVDNGQTTFGNTKTGEAIAKNFSAQQGDDILTGTTAGSGNTAFRVDFSQGAPVFYTTYASSNDLVRMFSDSPLLGKIATAAAAYFGGPAGVAALQAAMGKSVTDIAKGALLTYVGGEIAGNISGSADLVNSVGVDAANVIGKSVGKFVSSEGKADIITSLAGGAVDVGVGQITDNIEGFKDLSQGQQDFTRSVVATTIKNGGDLSMGDLVDAAFTAGTAAAKASATGSIATAIEANKTINDAVTAEIDKQTTIDASGAMDLNAAAAFAADSGYNKFTFDGKKYTLDNNNAENTIKQLEADALAANTEKNLAGGEFAGLDQAIADAAKRNTVAIGNAEADNPEEAAWLAKQRNPSASQFTFGGQTYTMTASQGMMDAAIKEAEAGTTKTAATTGTQTKTNTALANYVNNKLSQNLSSPDFNPADLTKDEMAKFVSTYANATDAQKAQLLKGADKATFSVIDTLLKQTVKLNPSLAGDQPVPAGSTDLKAWDKSAISTAVDVAKAAGNVAAADVAGLGVRGAQFLGDLMGQDTDGFAKVQNLLVNDKDKSMSKLVGNEKVVAGGIASGVESAVAWTLGGPMAGVATIAGVVANNSWVEGANAGLSPVDNAKRTAAMTAIEVAGEMLGIPGMKAIMKGIPVTGSVSQIVNGLTKAGGGLLSENASELLTTVAQFGVDKFASFGLSKDASFEDFQNALKDTIIATTAAVGTSSGISTATRAAKGTDTKQIADADRTAVSPDTSLLTSGASFGAKPGDTSNQGLNQVSSEAIDFNKLDQSKQTTILDNLRSTIANVGLTAALTLGSVGSIANATEVESYVSTSIQQAASTGVNVDKAINTSVSESINSAVTNKVSSETAINSAVSSAVSTAINNNVNTSTAINSAVTSAVNTASTNAASTTAAVTTAVNSAVSTVISTSVANNTLNTATVNAAVNTAVNSAVQAAVANNVSTTSAVNTAVTAAVTAAVANNVSTTAAVQAAVAAVTNLNVNVAAVTALATNVATETAEKTELVNTVNDLITGNKVTDDKVTDDTKVVTPPDVIVEPPPKTSTPTGSGGGAGMMGALGGFTFSGSGVIDPIKESFLKTYQTKDRFQDPLEKLHLIQEAEQSATQQMINQGIDPHLANVLASRLGTDMQGDQDNPAASNLWRFGQQPDDIDTMFGDEDKAFKEGGFVAPLQMASGGAMALPLLAKSGGALGALPRPDGRMDFRHGAHVAGEGDGQSDDIKAMLADGEFVFPADVVSALGNGSTKAGSDKLYEMMHAIRDRARSTGTKDLPPPALKSPLDYLKKGSKK